MNKVILSFIALIVCSNFNYGQNTEPQAIEFLEFIKGKDSLVDAVLSDHKKYRLQIIYGQVTHHSKDSVEVINSAVFNENYFYPASAIKLPCAILAMEKLNELNIDTSHYFRIDNEFICGNTKHIKNSQGEKDSYYDIIRNMIVVSNNIGYNSVYEFLTPGYIKKKLSDKNLHNIHIYKKFAGCNLLDNLKCNSIRIYDIKNQLIYKQEASVLNLYEMAENFTYSEKNLIGAYSYVNSKKRNGPFDFNYGVSASLADLHQSLINLIYPQNIMPSQRWNLKESDRLFLIKMLGMFPRELKDPMFHDVEKYPDNFLKYIVFGNKKTKTENVRSFSKIGLAFGFTTEIAYVVDLENKKEYFLSISMYTNKNKTINDGIYEYNQISAPFCGKLGSLLLEYEATRTNKYTPDFSGLKSLYR